MLPTARRAEPLPPREARRAPDRSPRRHIDADGVRARKRGGVPHRLRGLGCVGPDLAVRRAAAAECRPPRALDLVRVELLARPRQRHGGVQGLRADTPKPASAQAPAPRWLALRCARPARGLAARLDPGRGSTALGANGSARPVRARLSRGTVRAAAFHTCTTGPFTTGILSVSNTMLLLPEPVAFWRLLFSL